MAHRFPRVLLADDHPVMLAGLRKLLEPELEVVAMVMDGQELLEVAERLRPDLVITDVAMPGLDGIEATRLLQAVLPGVRVLILSIHAEPSYVRAAFDAGAWGYLTKSSAPEEIERAVREVLTGHFYVSPEVARAAIGGGRHRESLLRGSIEALTPREVEILLLVAEGLSNQQIGGRLGMAVTTVRTHLSSVYGKLRVKTRVELALYVAQSGGMAS
ncbi:MAG TPA: response regulator transcription factor [Thermoanaerobaculia bacterium]|nr:response regulator transcription factor [Thermoanaerobaculia bacterium]